MAEILLALNTDQKLTARDLQVAAQAAQIKMHEYKAEAEAKFKTLEQDAMAKSQILVNYLASVGTDAKIETAKAIFDFDLMAFIKAPVSVTPGPALPAPVSVTPGPDLPPAVS